MADRCHVWPNEVRSSAGPAICPQCGINWDEYVAQQWEEGRWPRNGPCTGNAYICRVARKLLAAEPQITYSGDVRSMLVGFRPWELKPADFRMIVNYKIGISTSEKATALIRRIPDDPSVCLILADALEEAGCTNTPLLDALRTT